MVCFSWLFAVPIIQRLYYCIPHVHKSMHCIWWQNVKAPHPVQYFMGKTNKDFAEVGSTTNA